MNDLSLKVYDKVDNKIFAVAQLWFNYEGVKTVQIYGKASPMPQKGMKNPNAFSARTPVQRLDRKRIEVLLPTFNKDKEGTLIYDGDILHTVFSGKDLYHVVKWDKDRWQLPMPLENFTIVGHKFTNPELIHE